MQNYAKFILAGLCSVKRSTDYQTTALVLPPVHNVPYPLSCPWYEFGRLVFRIIIGKLNGLDGRLGGMDQNSDQDSGFLFFLLALSYFFFGAVHAAYLGLFLDGIVDAVRDKHYPRSSYDHLLR